VRGILAYNALAFAFLAACVFFVATGHQGFGVACLVLAALCSHTKGSSS